MERICKKCNSKNISELKTSFMGFNYYKCNDCGNDNFIQLKKVYKIIYYIFLILLIMQSINLIIHGLLPVSGLLGIFGIFALIKDYKLTKEINLKDEY